MTGAAGRVSVYRKVWTNLHGRSLAFMAPLQLGPHPSVLLLSRRVSAFALRLYFGMTTGLVALRHLSNLGDAYYYH